MKLAACRASEPLSNALWPAIGTLSATVTVVAGAYAAGEGRLVRPAARAALLGATAIGVATMALDTMLPPPGPSAQMMRRCVWTFGQVVAGPLLGAMLGQEIPVVGEFEPIEGMALAMIGCSVVGSVSSVVLLTGLCGYLMFVDPN